MKKQETKFVASSAKFETHITVDSDGPNRLRALQDWAAIHGLKCLLIVLDRGKTISQPMLSRRGEGTLRGELETAVSLGDSLSAAGFQVVRIKIETEVDSENVPRLGADITPNLAGQYFEHHVKILLNRGADTSALVDVAGRHRAHLSRNAFSIRDDGFEDRFVTQRCWAVGSAEASSQLHALLAEIKRSRYTVHSVEEEFVVYDSNIAVDDGWIEGGHP